MFASLKPSKRSLIKMAVWHEERAATFPEQHPSRLFHESEANSLRERAETAPDRGK